MEVENDHLGRAAEKIDHPTVVKKNGAPLALGLRRIADEDLVIQAKVAAQARRHAAENGRGDEQGTPQDGRNP